MRIDVVSLFPEFVRQCAGFGVIGRAAERGLLEVEAWNPRDYAEGGYRRVDDSVCGGGPGMVMLIEHEVDEELSIGDYVLSGGELAAAVLIDAVGRLQEGALGDAQSAAQDSFSDGLLDCPHYTRPVSHEYGDVPAVLLSGDHAAINRWRRMQSLGRSWLRRPDLLEQTTLDAQDRRLLEEFKREYKGNTHEQDH